MIKEPLKESMKISMKTPIEEKYFVFFRGGKVLPVIPVARNIECLDDMLKHYQSLQDTTRSLTGITFIAKDGCYEGGLASGGKVYVISYLNDSTYAEIRSSGRASSICIVPTYSLYDTLPEGVKEFKPM